MFKRSLRYGKLKLRSSANQEMRERRRLGRESGQVDGNI